MSYQYPSIELLDSVGIYEEEPESQEEMKQNAEIIRQTLADFRIKVEPGPNTQGPTVTRYEFIPDRGIRMSRIIELSDNIAAVLKAVSINILAPIPGKNAIGIETPNNNHVPVSMREMVPVSMREMLESKEWANTKAQLPIALGEDLYHKPIITDLAKAPHLLIAGSTGSGKSVCINSIITSLLYKFSPEQLRFIMVDPKQVELQQYNDLAHMIVPVITDPKKAVLALRWLVEEMEKRYTMFAKAGVRNIEGFNSHSVDGEKLFYIVLIIDELNDLMLIAGKDVQDLIMRITQLARAAGIHCIIATQRPSVDVITGVIKANIPARIAFKVSNRQDSNTILDSIGAEKLFGYGDMLFLPPGKPKKRIQGAYVSDDEINRILDHIKTQAQPNFFEDLESTLERSLDEADDKNEDEELIQKCIDLIYSLNRSNISLLRRILKLGFGYSRAARIMDILERRGIVGPIKGTEIGRTCSKPRQNRF